MSMINFPGILQNFGKNVNFGNFQNNCQVNSGICVFVSKYLFKIFVLFRTFSSRLTKLETVKVLNTKNIA